MLFATQIPLTDVRLFSESDTNRLNLPSWPLPEAYRHFIRNSGVVREWWGGSSEYWPGEEYYCNARRALRFHPFLQDTPVGSFGNSLYFGCAFRRFFSNGESVSRFEIGLDIQQSESWRNVFPLDGKGCLNIIQACLSLEVKIRSTDSDFIVCNISNCGRNLAKLYLKSTTKIDNKNLPFFEDWWVLPGSPIFLIEYDENEISNLPKYARPVKPQSVFKNLLHICRIQRYGKAMGIWFLKRTLEDSDLTHRIRLNIFRLHAEKECLTNILRLTIQEKLHPEARTLSSDKLQKYLLGSIKLLSKQTRFGLPQTKIREEVQSIADLIRPSERANLLNQLSKIDIRPNIRKNLDNFIGEFVKTKGESTYNYYSISDTNQVIIGKEIKGGNFEVTKHKVQFGDNAKLIDCNIGVADKIQGSFNKIASSDTTDEIKRKMEELIPAVAEMIEHLPEDKKEEAAKDLEALTNEALSKNPRRKWYELSAEGLKEAAKTVGKVGEKVIPIIGALIPLLSGAS